MLWGDLGNGGRRGEGSACGDLGGVFGDQNDSVEELEIVEVGEEGGESFVGVLGTVLTCGERSNLTLLLLGWGGDVEVEALRGCCCGFGKEGGGGK